MLEAIIDRQKDKTSIMLVKNGVLIEKHEEYCEKPILEGNIYCGKVRDILQGMGSAFIDIGDSKNAFIRLKDVFPQINEAKNKENSPIKFDCNIKDYLKIDDKILVQIKKDGLETKGARVSTHINIVGRFIVLMPNSNFLTISQKIENKNERERLLNLVKDFLPKNTGAIIRTSAQNIDDAKLKHDLQELIKKWKDIKKVYEEYRLNGPKLIYDSKSFLRKSLIDLIDQNLNRIIVKDIDIYKDIKEILQNMDMTNVIEVDLRKHEDLLDMYSLREQLDKLKNRKIWLKSGGFIAIDKTEALTAIDVNSGKYIGKKNLETTVFKVNKEATIEIAKQLRLRDIGGIIIVDYIDMNIEENKNEIINILTEELKKDRSKTQIMGFTKLNLLEMTRKSMCTNENPSDNL